MRRAIKLMSTGLSLQALVTARAFSCEAAQSVSSSDSLFFAGVRGQINKRPAGAKNLLVEVVHAPAVRHFHFFALREQKKDAPDVGKRPLVCCSKKIYLRHDTPVEHWCF